jgi:O-antigen/teichoic acid export membrane protein
LNPLKRLASQTAVYGVSSVVGRFLNYLLVPLFTYTFAPAQYGVVSEFYAYMGFLAVLLVFGLETGYFRFRDGDGSTPEHVYSTALRFVILTNGAFVLAAWLLRQPVADLLRHGAHPEYIWWVGAILAMDSVGAVAFARLRAEQRAARFAAIKVIEIGVNIGLNLFFIVLCRRAFETNPHSALGALWSPAVGVGYIFLANLAGSAVKLVLLGPLLVGVLDGFDRALFARLIRYSLPMVVIGFAGIINEMLDRAALKYLLPYDMTTNMAQLGIYSACYKLSILMSLFIQAFRYAGEPFFFAYARQTGARETYARVLNYFVIFCVMIFLAVTLYIDVFKYFIGAPYRVGLKVVPVLLLANLMLGVYVNLSIWYKLTDQTLMGAWVSLVGAAVTVGLLLWWVPLFGYMGAAWATLVCYATMVLLSWLLGRRYYPVPYDLKRLLGYIALGLGLYGADQHLIAVAGTHSLLIGTLCMAVFVAAVLWVDGRGLLGRLRAAA